MTDLSSGSEDSNEEEEEEEEPETPAGSAAADACAESRSVTRQGEGAQQRQAWLASPGPVANLEPLLTDADIASVRDEGLCDINGGWLL